MHKCPFTFYGQLVPTRVPENLMVELEQEIFEPSGISTVEPPDMILKGVLMSESCGILYHIDGSTGIRCVAPSRQRCAVPEKVLVHGGTIAMSSHVCCCRLRCSFHPKTIIVDAGWTSVIYLVMLFLLSRQITVSRTPAGISRLSRWTFFTQALIDAIAFAIVGTLRYYSS